MTSALFEPIRLRDLTLPNRIVVSPMCQYSAADGDAGDWHVIHLGQLALGGAGLLILEATAVDPVGRITPDCLGLWSDANESALRRVLDVVRRHSPIPLAIQLAHAGRRRRAAGPGTGRTARPRGGWVGMRRAVGRAARRRRARPTRSLGGRAAAARGGVRPLGRASGASRVRRDRAPCGARVPAARVPLAAREPQGRRLRGLSGEQAALPARGRRGRSRRLALRTPAWRSRLGDRLGRGGLGPRPDARPRRGAPTARRRLDRRVGRRPLAAPVGSGGARIPGAARRGDQIVSGTPRSLSADHGRVTRRRSSPGQPTWSRWHGACSSTRAGLARGGRARRDRLRPVAIPACPPAR